MRAFRFPRPSYRFHPVHLTLCLGFSTLTLASCTGDFATGDVRSGIKKALGNTDEQIFVGEAVENYYHPNVIMKRGEAYFEKEEYGEALTEYKHFLDLHRNHVLAPYAAFRIGEIYFKTAKTIDRDPEPMQKAIESFERLIKDFPGSRYENQAQQKLQECHEWLAQMHLFVGQFYYRRGSYLAAAHRFELIMQTYPSSPIAPEALYFLAKSYHDLGADDWARDHLVVLAKKYPDGKYATEGKSLLASLGGAQTLLAQQSDSTLASDVNPVGQSPRFDIFNQPTTVPQSIDRSSSLDSPNRSSANGLSQGFTACRIGAWC